MKDVDPNLFALQFELVAGSTIVRVHIQRVAQTLADVPTLVPTLVRMSATGSHSHLLPL